MVVLHSGCVSAASHITVPGVCSCCLFQSSFLPVYTAGGSRCWFWLGSCRPSGNPDRALDCWLPLGSDLAIGSIWNINQQMPPCVSCFWNKYKYFLMNKENNWESAESEQGKEKIKLKIQILVDKEIKCWSDMWKYSQACNPCSSSTKSIFITQHQDFSSIRPHLEETKLIEPHYPFSNLSSKNTDGWGRSRSGRQAKGGRFGDG